MTETQIAVHPATDVQGLILDWAGTVVDFGSFAPTSIFVEAFARAYDFEVTLEEARQPMGLGKWDHIAALGRLPSVDARWQARFGHPVLLLETFVDPQRFYGGVYRASNWTELGLTQGYRRTRSGYSEQQEQNVSSGQRPDSGDDCRRCLV